MVVELTTKINYRTLLKL